MKPTFLLVAALLALTGCTEARGVKAQIKEDFHETKATIKDGFRGGKAQIKEDFHDAKAAVKEKLD